MKLVTKHLLNVQSQGQKKNYNYLKITIEKKIKNKYIVTQKPISQGLIDDGALVKSNSQ